eukprot:gb/GECG01008151.1/.p1 GENE.gb/GECG01008151.1/~~gb/GECG01008151.1/.p1  ORF type:complete len:376 (+),score=44.11 gb/GECG01008151.1/:1-1128(+)
MAAITCGRRVATSAASRHSRGYLAYTRNFRSFSTGPTFTPGEPFRATLFPGDGIGPEISEAVQRIFEVAKVPIEWDHQIISGHVVNKDGDLISEEALNSVRQNGVGLKGPFGTPIGTGHRSLNLTLRKALNLYANVRPCVSVKGYETKYKNVDVVTIRENTEGEYSGLEHEVVKGVVENVKVITRHASERIAHYAFEYAHQHGRKTVCAVHKATIMKIVDGLFLECCREAAAKYPDIKYEEMVMDKAMLTMAANPTYFDVMVMPNLYGDIASDLAAGLIGGLGLTPSGNIGEDASVFEAVHGTAPDIQGQDKANPTALLLSGCMMLRHVGHPEKADAIQDAALGVIADGRWRTGDLGGSARCSEFTQAVIDRINI